VTEPTQELELAQHAGLFKSDEPDEIIARATHTAGALAEVIQQQKLFIKISGRDHVRVEGWTLLGTLLGVFPYTVWTRPIEDGWEARCEARTLNGQTVGAAEAECLKSESNWRTRDDYAIRSMAQTRATSKALRQPLGFVMALAGFDPTPAEEMPKPVYVRTRQVLGPENVEPEPGPDFGPVEDPADAQLEPPTDRLQTGEPVGSSFQAPKIKEPGPVDARPLTDPQRRKIYAMINKLRKVDPERYGDERVRQQLGAFYGTESVAELTRYQARELIDLLERREQELGA
jgi:hypothetical protein